MSTTAVQLWVFGAAISLVVMVSMSVHRETNFLLEEASARYSEGLGDVHLASHSFATIDGLGRKKDGMDKGDLLLSTIGIPIGQSTNEESSGRSYEQNAGNRLTTSHRSAPSNESSSAVPSDNDDAACPFRRSSIYRKVFVYPNYGDADWKGSILSEAARTGKGKLHPWPWLQYDRMQRDNGSSHYDIDSEHVQYATELLVREIMTNPKSCLRTDDPETATLFYVPYLPSVEFHRGRIYPTDEDYKTSPYGQAILNILNRRDYTAWESTFGLTSKYWKRRNGSDHILVFSEPLHGLSHPRFHRGNYHYLHTQKQTSPPIVISVELSKTFVQMYPKCAAKNILLPYPNTDGRWYNDMHARNARRLVKQLKIATTTTSPSALPNEKEAAKRGDTAARPVAQFYQAGNHGACKQARMALQSDYRSCSPSHTKVFHTISSRRSPRRTSAYRLGMQVSTFCPAPGGDSPSAKRMFDACLAGCIPVVLSQDFVWPFTSDIDPTSYRLNASEFSVSMRSNQFPAPRLDRKTCRPIHDNQPSLEGRLQALSVEQIQLLRRGLERVRHLYSWYQPDDLRMVVDHNPLRNGILPTGGTAHALVEALAARAGGIRWPSCQEELATRKEQFEEPKVFKC